MLLWIFCIRENIMQKIVTEEKKMVIENTNVSF